MVIQMVVIKFIYLLIIKLTFRRKKGQHSKNQKLALRG
ncbi:hypothetical protein LTSEWAN_1720, partial [Salmonella enterica subsp. enterica serovar Wandsworth str. A4-580]